MEISQSTKSKLDQGALIIATFTSMSYYKLLVQEGLDIPRLVKVYMHRTVKNKQIILMYEEMIEVLYQEKDG